MRVFITWVTDCDCITRYGLAFREIHFFPNANTNTQGMSIMSMKSRPNPKSCAVALGRFDRPGNPKSGWSLDFTWDALGKCSFQDSTPRPSELKNLWLKTTVIRTPEIRHLKRITSEMSVAWNTDGHYLRVAIFSLTWDRAEESLRFWVSCLMHFSGIEHNPASDSTPDVS